MYRSVLQFNQLFYNGQAKTCSAILTSGIFICLLKAVKYGFHFMGSDPYSRIFYRKGNVKKNPNFAKMAEAIGIMGVRVENSEDVPGAIEKALKHDGPVLIDVLTNPTELAMPPKINFEEAKGFGIYMIRQTLLGDGAEVWDTLKTNFLD
jgi:hypothetical protein